MGYMGCAFAKQSKNRFFVFLISVLSFNLACQKSKQESRGIASETSTHLQNSSNYGFAANFQSPQFRSDYDDIYAGTPLSPLTYDECMYEVSIIRCPQQYMQDEGSIDRLPSLRSPASKASENAFVISANNEVLAPLNYLIDDNSIDRKIDAPPYDAHHNCNPGPPNESFFVREDDLGGAGVYALRDGGIELFLNSSFIANQGDENLTDCGPYSVPFLAFGSQQDRGQEHPVAILAHPNHPDYLLSPNTLSFSAILKEFEENPRIFDHRTGQLHSTASSHVRIFFTAQWGGENRMLFVNLKTSFKNGGSDHLAKVDWNWPIRESFYYPGGDLAFFEIDQIQETCGFGDFDKISMNRETEYKLNLSLLFQCASDLGLFNSPMPDDQHIPVTGIHWALESHSTVGRIRFLVKQAKIEKANLNARLSAAKVDAGFQSLGPKSYQCQVKDTERTCSTRIQLEGDLPEGEKIAVSVESNTQKVFMGCRDRIHGFSKIASWIQAIPDRLYSFRLHPCSENQPDFSTVIDQIQVQGSCSNQSEWRNNRCQRTNENALDQIHLTATQAKSDFRKTGQDRYECIVTRGQRLCDIDINIIGTITNNLAVGVAGNPNLFMPCRDDSARKTNTASWINANPNKTSIFQLYSCNGNAADRANILHTIHVKGICEAGFSFVNNQCQ